MGRCRSSDRHRDQWNWICSATRDTWRYTGSRYRICNGRSYCRSSSRHTRHDIFARTKDIIVRITVAETSDNRLHNRIRHRSTDSSCGLCGIEALDQVLRPLPRVIANSQANDAAIFCALAALDGSQHLNDKTRAVHGAALCAKDGRIRMIREDVGRHNAFDKLIGAMYRLGMGWDAGFALLTSRCSYELVEKAAMASCPLLVTVSGATGLALSRAAEAGLPLRVLARPDALLTP